MQFRDLQVQYAALKTEMDQAVLSAVRSGKYIMGPEVAELEDRLAAYTGVQNCITCANGTDALHLALMAKEIGPGDAVFVPDFTFFATAEMASLCGATPVFVDIDPRTFNMCPSSLEEKIKGVLAGGRLKPACVIPVDLYGLPADYDRIAAVCQKYGLWILEDAAQGFGGSIGDKKACSFGEIAATSFFPSKPLGCYGDGGAIFTDDDALAERIQSLRVHGKGSDKYDNVRIGLNSRLDTVQAAVLLVKLNAFEKYELEAVNKAAKGYDARLKNTVETPFIPNGFYSSWAQYTIKLKDRQERDVLQRRLKDRGIPTMIYYPKPLHTQKAYEALGGDCPQAEDICGRVLSLPIHPYMEDGDIDRVCEAIIQSLKAIEQP